MSSLRRDLLERRMWPFAVVLLAAIVAVPFLLAGRGGHAEADLAAATGPVPSAPAPAKSTTDVSKRSSAQRVFAGSTSRNPFAGPSGPGSGTTTVKTTSTGTQTTASSTQTTTSDSSTGTSASAASSTGGGSPSTSTASSGAASNTGAGSSRATSTKTVVTPVVKDPATGAVSKGPWKVYSVVATLSGRGWKQTHSDIERLTPLPKASFPKVMYMGAVNSGRQVVFELGTGVDASGSGSCRPSRRYCDLVVLSRGQTEHLSYLLADGTERSMTLTVNRIDTSVTDSATTAASAFNRRSEIGACEVELGDPIQFNYDATSGALQPASSTNACRGVSKAVPFPGDGSGL